MCTEDTQAVPAFHGVAAAIDADTSLTAAQQKSALRHHIARVLQTAITQAVKTGNDYKLVQEVLHHIGNLPITAS